MDSGYFIGIDGGGTNSRLLAADPSGRILGTCRGKTTSLESNAPSVVKTNLVQLLHRFEKSFDIPLRNCIGLCLGTSGVDTEFTRLAMENMLEDIVKDFPIYVVNDSEIALYANTQGHPGLMIISGTGSIGYGINHEGKVWRVDGYGYLVGDRGSAHWVGKEGVEAALQAYDHSGPDTCLVNDFSKYLGLQSFDEIVDFIYQKNKSDLAQLAFVVEEGRAKNDPVSVGIMNGALDNLMLLIRTLVTELEMSDQSYPLVLGGGFLSNTKWLLKSLKARVKEEFPLLCAAGLKTPAEYGAVYMVASKLGIQLPELFTSKDESIETA